MISMSKKPSEVIESIRKQMAEKSGFETYTAHLIPAIIHYLDQQWEKEQPCEHDMEVDGFKKKCKKCGMTNFVYASTEG